MIGGSSSAISLEIKSTWHTTQDCRNAFVQGSREEFGNNQAFILLSMLPVNHFFKFSIVHSISGVWCDILLLLVLSYQQFKTQNIPFKMIQNWEKQRFLTFVLLEPENVWHLFLLDNWFKTMNLLSKCCWFIFCWPINWLICSAVLYESSDRMLFKCGGDITTPHLK